MSSAQIEDGEGITMLRTKHYSFVWITDLVKNKNRPNIYWGIGLRRVNKGKDRRPDWPTWTSPTDHLTTRPHEKRPLGIPAASYVFFVHTRGQLWPLETQEPACSWLGYLPVETGCSSWRSTLSSRPIRTGMTQWRNTCKKWPQFRVSRTYKPNSEQNVHSSQIPKLIETNS